MHPCPCVVLGDLEPVGHLWIGEPVELLEQEGVALRRRQRVDGVVHGAQHDGVRHPLEGIALVDLAQLDTTGEAALGRGAAAVVVAHVAEDPAQPRAEPEFAGLTEPAHRAERALERLLQRVLGVAAVAQAALGLREEHAVVVGHDGPESVRIARAVRFDQGAIAVAARPGVSVSRFDDHGVSSDSPLTGTPSAHSIDAACGRGTLHSARSGRRDEAADVTRARPGGPAAQRPRTLTTAWRTGTRSRR